MLKQIICVCFISDFRKISRICTPDSLMIKQTLCFDLVCMIEWRTTVHDGPVKIMAKCPFMPHLLLSVGGYSFAVWNEGVMVSFYRFRK